MFVKYSLQPLLGNVKRLGQTCLSHLVGTIYQGVMGWDKSCCCRSSKFEGGALPFCLVTNS